MENEQWQRWLLPHTQGELETPGRYVIAALINLLGYPFIIIPAGIGYFVLKWPGRAVAWIALSLSQLILLMILFLIMGSDSPGRYGEPVLMGLLWVTVAVWIESVIYPTVLAVKAAKAAQS